MRRLALSMCFIVLCVLGCGDQRQPDDAGVDATAETAVDDSAIDTGPAGCTVNTCSGPVFLLPGQSVPYGDNCNDNCTCKDTSGYLVGGCGYLAGCTCVTDGGSTD